MILKGGGWKDWRWQGSWREGGGGRREEGEVYKYFD